jgi:predicted RNase H-like HicB family nuclease
MDVMCDDDEQAKRRAEQLLDGHVVELWQKGRKIAEFKPQAMLIRK